MKIEFTSPNQALSGEKRSKLLKPGSEFYNYLEQEYQKLNEKYPGLVGNKRMDYHIELIFRGQEPTKDLLVNRAMYLEGKDIDDLSLKVFGRALCVDTPKINGKRTHATIAFFPNGVPNDAI